MKLIKASVLMMAVTAMAVTATAVSAIEFEKPEDGVSHRQHLMDLVGDNFGQLAPVIKDKSTFRQEAFSQYAERLAALATWIEDAYEKKIITSQSKARESLWSEGSDFKQLLFRFKESTARLVTLIPEGDVAVIQKAVKAVAADCKSCHKSYRE